MARLCAVRKLGMTVCTLHSETFKLRIQVDTTRTLRLTPVLRTDALWFVKPARLEYCDKFSYTNW